jgi:acyl-coenzyme A synthetase/AMP-(fatty) acid ligase
MGFSKLRVAYTAGEAIGPELFSFFRSLGINLKQLYGQTEASVFITLQPDGEVYPETVGKPGPDIEIKIEDSGEVLFKSPVSFSNTSRMTRRRPQPRRRTAGCGRETPASSISGGICASSIAPRTSAD